MKLIICLAFLLVLSVCVLDVNANSCLGFNDVTSCKWNECCAKRMFPKTGLECKSKGDKVNARCGGEYKCGCTAGLNCVPDKGGILNKLKPGAGTCKPVVFIQG